MCKGANRMLGKIRCGGYCHLAVDYAIQRMAATTDLDEQTVRPCTPHLLIICLIILVINFSIVYNLANKQRNFVLN